MTRVCNACGSPLADEMLRLEDYEFDVPGEYALVRCCQCGLLYLREPPSMDELRSHYPPEYAPYRRAIEDEPWKFMRWVRRCNIVRYRRVVERHSARSPGVILDVGCSTGIFLSEMERLGWETFGVEPSPSASEYARSRLGLRVYTGTLDTVGLPRRPYSAVTLWDVLEHTSDPSLVLRSVHALLDDWGIVVVTVPNYNSFDRYLFGAILDRL